MRKLMLLFPVLLPAALLALAQPAKPGAKSGPCSLLTKAEVQEATGAAASDPKLNANNSSVCDFKVGDFNAVGVMLGELGPNDSADKTMAELNKRKIQTQPVSGIGDRAFFASPGYGMQQLSAYKGSKYVIVTALIMGAPEAKVRGIIQILARKALARL
jgi:hypothetical protein